MNPYGGLDCKAGAPGAGGGSHMSRSPQGLSFFKKRLCAIGWVVFFPFFFPHVPPLLSLPPKSLHQSYCGQCWERTAIKKKKNTALVVLLWASPRVHVSANVTAWVADDAAVGQGHGQPLPELQSSFSNGGSWRGWGVIKIQHSWVRGILRPLPPEDVLSIGTCLFVW